VKCVVLGGGLNGLIAGNVMQEHGYEVTVYERNVVGGLAYRLYEAIGGLKTILFLNDEEFIEWLSKRTRLERTNLRMSIFVEGEVKPFPEYLRKVRNPEEIINLYQFKRGASCLWVADRPREPSLMSCGVAYMFGDEEKVYETKMGYLIKPENVNDLAEELNVVRAEVKSVNLADGKVRDEFGGEEGYDVLISTVPLPVFCRLSGIPCSLESYPTLFSFFEKPDVEYEHIYFPYTPPIFYRATVMEKGLMTETQMTDLSYEPSEYQRVVVRNVRQFFGELECYGMYVYRYGYLKVSNHVREWLNRLRTYLRGKGVYLIGKTACWDYRKKIHHAYYDALKICRGGET